MDSDFSDFDGNFDAFISLKSLNKCFEEQEFVCALDIHSICHGNNAICTIISDDEVINLKVTIDCSNYQNPLSFKPPTRIKNVAGRRVVANKTSSFLLTRDGNLLKFKSSKALEQNVTTSSVVYLESFNFNDDRCCFLMISTDNSKVVLQLYDQFFEAGDYVCPRKEVTLIHDEDQIATLENDLSAAKISQNYTFASELLTDLDSDSNESTTDFFNAFLGINIKEEGMRDIVLLSVNDRLLFMKYRGSFAFDSMALDDEEGEDGEIVIEPVLITRGKIKEIKFINDALMIIDDFWMLSIYFFCPLARIVKKKELQLVGEVACFRFTQNYLIYSNQLKIIFMKFSEVSSYEPEVFEIDLSMITTFTVIQRFLIAIDKNHFFYYVPVRSPVFIHDRAKQNNQYEQVMDADIIKYPEAIRYLQSAEKQFRSLADEIERESNLTLFLDQLLQVQNFVAGSAKIEFLPSLPRGAAVDDIICKPTNARAGHSYIKISVELEAIVAPFSFTIAFYRHASVAGTLVRHIDVEEKNKCAFNIFVPAEMEDGPNNRMELFLHFSFNSNGGDKHVLQFPMNLTQVMENELYQSVVPNEMDGCLQTLTKLMKQNNL